MQNVCKAEDGHGERIRRGLRRAARNGSDLGGLRPATQRRNAGAHVAGLKQALDFRVVLEAGRDKPLSALSRDLFAAGCRCGSGKPLTPEMVRRLRSRLVEAKLALAAGILQVESMDCLPEYQERLRVLQKDVLTNNAVALRWHLRMAGRDYGSAFAARLRQDLLVSDRSGWVSSVLTEP